MGRTHAAAPSSPDESPPATVHPPVPPGDPDAWYAPDVRAQRELYPGVVATVRAS